MRRQGISSQLSIAWIRPLARPYLRGYRAVAEHRGALRGYWFLPPSPRRPRARQLAREATPGFFLGYLVSAKDFAFLSPEPPECLVFAFVRPVGGALHRRLVRRPESLLRGTFEYIRWLTHRPPRFVFHADRLPAMVRHLSMREWPSEEYEHYSRNFFAETLAWLVRSALVRRLLVEAPGPARRSKARRGERFTASAQKQLS